MFHKCIENFPELPSAPQSLHVVKETISSITLEWAEPLSDGGAPITGYLISMKGPDDNDFKCIAKIDGDVLSHTVTKLTPDSTYDFEVACENEVGISKDVARLSPSAKTKQKACKFCAKS